MNEIRFEWDNNKAAKNVIKHKGISFIEAITVFEDENAILFDDPDHSTSEERFLILGLSSKPNLLIVCHCYRDSGEVIRIISARRATKKEAKTYEEFLGGW